MLWDTQKYERENSGAWAHKFAKYIVLMSCRQLRAILPNFFFLCTHFHFLCFFVAPLKAALKERKALVIVCWFVHCGINVRSKWSWYYANVMCICAFIRMLCCLRFSRLFFFCIISMPRSHLGESVVAAAAVFALAQLTRSLLFYPRNVMSIVGCHYTFTIADDPVFLSLYPDARLM